MMFALSRLKRQSMPMHSKASLLAAASSMALLYGISSSGATVLTADGALDAGYQLGFSIGFIDDKGNAIGDGKLYFGINDADNTQFLYFQMPLEYVDNTYGANASADWPQDKKTGLPKHKFSDLLGSDSMGSDKGVTFSWNSNAGTIDYIAGNPNNGTYGSGGFGDSATNDGFTNKSEGNIAAGNTSSIVEIATSLEYDLTVVDPSATTDSSLNSNWIKEVGYEIQFAAGTFNATDWLDPTAALSLITLGTPHVSPPKSEKFGSYDTPECIVGCGGSNTSLPEASTLPLLAFGLTGLLGSTLYRRRRKT